MTIQDPGANHDWLEHPNAPEPYRSDPRWIGNRGKGPRPFVLQRDEDETGISGTGVVAEGVEFSDGTVALRWKSDWPTSVVFHERGMEAVEAVHGHDGKTRVVWQSVDRPSMADMAHVHEWLRTCYREDNDALKAEVVKLADWVVRGQAFDVRLPLSIRELPTVKARLALTGVAEPNVTMCRSVWWLRCYDGDACRAGECSAVPA